MKKRMLLAAGLVVFLTACGDEGVEVEETAAEVEETETDSEEQVDGLHPVLESGIEDVRNWTSYSSITGLTQEVSDDETMSFTMETESIYMQEPLTIFNKMTTSSGGAELIDEAFLKDGVTYVRNEQGQWEAGDGSVELTAEDMQNNLVDLMQSFVDFSSKIEELSDTEIAFDISPANATGVLNAFFQYIYGIDFEGEIVESEDIYGQIFHDGTSVTGVAFNATVIESTSSNNQNMRFTVFFENVNSITEIAPEDFNL